MGRVAGSGAAGKTRSTRLPRALDEWFTERLERHPEQSATELLLQLIHGGLRLREGYMAIHRRALEELGGPQAQSARPRGVSSGWRRLPRLELAWSHSTLLMTRR